MLESIRQWLRKLTDNDANPEHLGKALQILKERPHITDADLAKEAGFKQEASARKVKEIARRLDAPKDRGIE